MDQIFDKLIAEEAYLAPYYCGCSLPTNLSENSSIGFVIPRNCTTKFVDSMCVPKTSTKKTKAEKYINFMCKKEISIANAKTSGYIPTRKDAELEVMADSDLFSEEGKTQVYKNLPNKIQTLADNLWIEIKSDNKKPIVNSIVLIGIFVLTLLAYFPIKTVKKKRYNTKLINKK
jgi:spermidine/putrescine-binding protein